MRKEVKRISNFWFDFCIRGYVEGSEKKASLFLLILAATILINSSDAYAYNGAKYGQLCKRLLETVEGKFGALLTAAAGIGAIVASAAGGFKMAWSLLVVAIGAFTLRVYQEIWFESCG